MARVVKLADILSLVDVRVALPQYRHLMDTSRFTVVRLTFEALRLLIRTLTRPSTSETEIEL